MNIKTDCKEFLGYIPCKPNKKFGAHCFKDNGEVCDYYQKTGKRILIVKLGAAGDVIRTTPLLTKLRQTYKNAYIVWLTHFPDLVPSLEDNSNGVDKIYKWETQSLYFLQSINFDIIINLDKDEYACGFTKNYEDKASVFGYSIKENRPYPVNKFAEHKYLTGLFDDISQKNEKNYIEEIFEICEFEYNKEEYILAKFNKPLNIELDKNKKIVGLNTGCGGRWTSRLWPEEYWIELAEILIKNNYEVILLGGPEEDEKNKKISKVTNAAYFGIYPLKYFMGIMNNCDIVVTVVTMAMHIAIGLKKQLVLLNNIFNKNEFELFGRGVIIEPEKKCQCYFSPECKNDEYKCIEYITPNMVFEKIINL